MVTDAKVIPEEDWLANEDAVVVKSDPATLIAQVRGWAPLQREHGDTKALEIQKQRSKMDTSNGWPTEETRS